MCILVEASAQLANTVVYAAEVDHPTEGRVHVIGYQNEVEGSGYGGANAMILPIPSAEPLGPGNVLDTRNEGLKDTLRTYRDAVEAMKPRLRSFDRGDVKGLAVAGAAASYQVFDSGAYTIALAERPGALHKALQLVPEDKRPNISTRFIFELGKAYPKWPMAICCFRDSDFRDPSRPEPIFWWYKPLDPDTLFAPAIDAHDGHPPRSNPVSRDHTLVFGSVRAQGLRDGGGVARKLPQHWALTPAIMGTHVQERTKNGDFIFPIKNFSDSTLPGYIGADRAQVQAPPGWM